MTKDPKVKEQVVVTPGHMSVLMLLGMKPGLTAEEINVISTSFNDVNLVLGALDDLIHSGVVRDEDAEYFELTDRGSELFQAAYNTIKTVEG